MNHQHLFKYSRSYALLKKYVGLVHSVYYSEICVLHKENIPVNEPVIFAPNHQNGLMDALAVALPIGKQPVFMARADIFNNRINKLILNFVKIIPVFRLKDGAGKMGNNDKSFDVALHVIGYGQPVVIMPEATHGGQNRLKPLKKGLVRFALQAQESFGDTARVKIVPVGIGYDHYNQFRGRLLVIFGKPVEVGEYMKSYQDNSAVAFNLLRDRLACEMKKIMLNIDSDEYYSLIFRIKEIYANRQRIAPDACDGYYNRFLAEKYVADRLVALASSEPAKLNTLGTLVNEYTNGLKRLGLADWIFEAKMPDRKTVWFDISKYLLFLPLFAASVMVHAVPVLICRYFSGRVGDTQLRSSFAFALGALLFPVCYLFFFLLPIPLYTKLLLILPMPVLAPLAYDYYVSVKEQWMKFRYFRMQKAGHYELNGLGQVRERLLRMLDELCSYPS
jgi:1-acyl-sn-glycerol-3-phosphate acyltransferase